jgi:hypothetical protein
MRKETRKIICQLIDRYMTENNIKYNTEPNPFPVSFKTIWSILNTEKKDLNICFSKITQIKLLNFFKIKFIEDGNDCIII